MSSEKVYLEAISEKTLVKKLEIRNKLTNIVLAVFNVDFIKLKIIGFSMSYSSLLRLSQI
jgi:hypothetical protein